MPGRFPSDVPQSVYKAEQAANFGVYVVKSDEGK